MSILNLSKENEYVCDKFDMYELGAACIVTMSNGHRFIVTRLNDDDLQPLIDSGATVEYLTELGV